MDAHLAKPYRIADLAATLRQVRSARAPLDALQPRSGSYRDAMT
jgi:hypothetical protein